MENLAAVDAGVTTHALFQKYTVGSLPKRKHCERVELPQHIFFFFFFARQLRNLKKY